MGRHAYVVSVLHSLTTLNKVYEMQKIKDEDVKKVITKTKDLSTYTVKSTSVTSNIKKVTVDLNGKTTPIKVHRFAQIGQNDRVFIDPNRSNHIYVMSSENPEDKIQVTPHFEKLESFKFCNSTYKLLIKEILTPSEFQDYEFLEGFHYKTSNAIISDEEDNDDRTQKDNGGRKSVLMCYLQIGTILEPAGYIELQMPLLMTKPRHVLFNKGFSHPHRPVSWDTWDLDSKKKYVNLIVRIARIVISPTLRGLGLAKIIIKTAKQYASERWHVQGKRPLFMEISAEMLKYLNFVSSTGLLYIGNTEGNLERVHKDLKYMQRGYKIGSGIMTLQEKYLNNLKRVASESNKKYDEVLDDLAHLTVDTSEDTIREKLNNLTPEEWYLFKKVLRFPIPYYLGGLDEATQKYLSEHAPAPQQMESKKITKIKNARLILNRISIKSKFKVPDSSYVRAVRNCFGIEGETLNSKILEPISIEASGGNIIMLTGSSGSGKSLLLKAIDPTYKDKNLIIDLENKSSNYSVAWLKELESDMPLIQYFSEKWGINSAISALNQAGLSEAFIYLKPYKFLSRGQQYRARLAELSLGQEPVWLVDEFCSDLDPFTAKIVANSFRKQVIKSGRIAIVAAANYEHFWEALKPTRLIVLRQNASAKIMNHQEFTDEFCQHAS